MGLYDQQIAASLLDYGGFGFNVRHKLFGAKAGGANDTAAFDAAVDAAMNAGGASVLVPPGTYLVDSLPPIEGGFVDIVGAGRSSVIAARTDGAQLVKVSSSYNGVRNLKLDANGKAGVHLLTLAPANEADLVTEVQISYNEFARLWLEGGEEGVVYRTGPGASGTYYNQFFGGHIFSCVRGIWLRDGVTGALSPANRNKWFGTRIGQNCNTGVQIDAADTCRFFGVDFEGINDFTSPNTVPTAIIVKELAGTGHSNSQNAFHGCRTEACTRNVENLNPSTMFIDFPVSEIDPTKWIGLPPALLVGSERNHIVGGTMYEKRFPVDLLASEANKTVRDFTAEGDRQAWRVFASMLNEYKYGVVFKDNSGNLVYHEDFASGANMTLSVSGQLFRITNNVASARTAYISFQKIAVG